MILLPIIIAFGVYSLINPSVFVDVLIWLLGILGYMLNILLTPINKLIENYIPALDNGAAAITQYVNTASTYLNWILDASLIPVAAINLIVLYYLFSTSFGIFVWTIKTPFKWVKAIL